MMREKTMNENDKVAGLPELAKSVIWMINFGYLGIQIAFTLETSQMSRIFQTLGADPTKLGWFFILPPLAGLVVQPAIGSLSDKTWAPKLGGKKITIFINWNDFCGNYDATLTKYRKFWLRLWIG